MAEVEQAGFGTYWDRQTKTKQDSAVSDEIDAPIMMDSLLTLFSDMEQEDVLGTIGHFVAKIGNRKVADNNLMDGPLDYGKLSPSVYMGVGKERIHRQLTDRSMPLGSFKKPARMKKRAKQPVSPVHETERLSSRAVEMADAPAMFAHASQERVANLAGFPFKHSTAELQSIIRDNFARSSIHRRYAI
ncbi:hypothetical protein [Streptococcus hyointestinalis]|uniref:hypothetical protein n=1 Tax=Streptococcus hyointestinalis TaxID=1337 RepID=UPI0013DEB4B0|nr:hypothetical protein [Streptococcus hyointestinalis]